MAMDARGDVQDLMRMRRLAETGAARAIRESAGLSLSEAEAGSGVERSTIWRWEMGRRRPHGPAALRYLAFLDELTGVRGREVVHG